MNGRNHSSMRGLPVATESSPFGMVPANTAHMWREAGPSLGYLDFEDETNSFDPAKLIWYVIHYRWLIVILTVIGLVAGYAFTIMQTPQYRATSQLEILAPSSRVVQELQLINETADIRTFRTAQEKLKGRELLSRVATQLNLANKPTFLSPAPSISLWNLVKRANRIISLENNELTTEQRERLAVESLQENLSVNLIRDTSILSISYSSPNPELAKSIANGIARSYLNKRLDDTKESSDLTRQFISEQVAEIKNQLQKSEQELVAYARANGLTIGGGEGSLYSANIKTVNQALITAVQERLASGRVVTQIKSGNGQNLQPVLADPALQALKAKLVELRATYQLKLSKFKPGFPEMRQLRAQIIEVRRQLTGGTKSILTSYQLRYEDALQKEKDLQKKLAELEVLQADYGDKNIRYTILKREVDSNRKQYDSLIDKMNTVDVASQFKSKNASIVELAITPSEPYLPNMPINILVGLVLSIGLAGSTIYVSELLNNTFTTPDQVENELKLPLLGIIPFVPEAKVVEELGNPKSSISEAYRSLRTSLQFTGTEGAPKTLVITSAEPSEGKSSTARKLAEEFGSLGMTVLLIDGDLRRPNLHRLLGVTNGMGLSNLLTNMVVKNQEEDSQGMEFLHDTPWPNVALMTAGTPPPNPANLLATEKMGLFVHACTQKFDMVIIDSPPVIGLADALLISRLGEATLMVVSANKVARKAAISALKRLKSAGGNVIGASFNRFKIERADYSYAYRYMGDNYLAYGNEPADTLPQISEGSTGSQESRNEGNSIANDQQNSPSDGAFSRMLGSVFKRS